MLDKKTLLELQDYLDQHLFVTSCEKAAEMEPVLESLSSIDIEMFIKEKQKPSLQKVLFGLIDRKNMTDAEVYKKAGLDRKHFSKIRSNPKYRPGKNTMIALALALELNKKETDKLLNSAGYSLSDSEMSDLIIQFCIEKKIYEIIAVNQALHSYDLKPLVG